MLIDYKIATIFRATHKLVSVLLSVDVK